MMLIATVLLVAIGVFAVLASVVSAKPRRVAVAVENRARR